jgi:hypothetical protein
MLNFLDYFALKNIILSCDKNNKETLHAIKRGVF